MTGTGNLNATVGGNVTSAVGGTGINALGSGTGGNIALTTAAGTTVRGDFVGVYGQINNPANAGTINVINNATVASLTGAPGTLDFGVFGETDGTGAVTVTNNGAVGTATDRVGTGQGVSGSSPIAASTPASRSVAAARYSARARVSWPPTPEPVANASITPAPINTTGASGVVSSDARHEHRHHRRRHGGRGRGHGDLDQR